MDNSPSRLIAVLVAALALVLHLTTPAGAAVYNYNIGGPVPAPGYAGSGASSGEVHFVASNIRQFRWIGRVRDICPADGAGMEVRARVRYRNGTLAWRNNIIQDLNGCGTAWVSASYPITYTQSLNIDAVRVHLWATEDGIPFVRVDASTWKNNPY